MHGLWIGKVAPKRGRAGGNTIQMLRVTRMVGTSNDLIGGMANSRFFGRSRTEMVWKDEGLLAFQLDAEV